MIEPCTRETHGLQFTNPTLSTPNLGVFDEKVFTHEFTILTHSVRPVTMANIPCVLGSDTECMAQVIYKKKPHRGD